MHKNAQLPEAHKNTTGSITAVSSSVNLSTKALKNRRLHTKPNFAVFNVAWKLRDIQTSCRYHKSSYLLEGFGWLLEQSQVSFLRLEMFSGIEVVYDTTNPFDPWQLVTVRSDSITNTAGLV